MSDKPTAYLPGSFFLTLPLQIGLKSQFSYPKSAGTTSVAHVQIIFYIGNLGYLPPTPKLFLIIIFIIQLLPPFQKKIKNHLILTK